MCQALGPRLSIGGPWTVEFISHHHFKVFSNFTEKSIILKNEGRKVIVKGNHTH